MQVAGIDTGSCLFKEEKKNFWSVILGHGVNTLILCLAAVNQQQLKKTIWFQITAEVSWRI